MTSGRDVIILLFFDSPPAAAGMWKMGGDTPHPAKGPCWPLGTPADSLRLLSILLEWISGFAINPGTLLIHYDD